jgi:hypothetical protein
MMRMEQLQRKVETSGQPMSPAEYNAMTQSASYVLTWAKGLGTKYRGIFGDKLLGRFGEKFVSQWTKAGTAEGLEFTRRMAVGGMGFMPQGYAAPGFRAETGGYGAMPAGPVEAAIGRGGALPMGMSPAEQDAKVARDVQIKVQRDTYQLTVQLLNELKTISGNTQDIPKGETKVGGGDPGEGGGGLFSKF